MKNSIKLALAVVAVAAATSAQAYTDGDLLVGFSGGSSDFIFDLGQASSLTAGETWNVGASKGTAFGVIGFGYNALQTDAYAYMTSASSSQNGNNYGGSVVGNAETDVATIGQQLTLGTSRSTTPSDATGWTYNTHNSASPLPNGWQNDFTDPNVAIGNTAYFFANAYSGSVTPESFFTYNSASGILTYGTAVPEPASFGILAGFGLLALAVRRQIAKA